MTNQELITLIQNYPLQSMIVLIVITTVTKIISLELSKK